VTDHDRLPHFRKRRFGFVLLARFVRIARRRERRIRVLQHQLASFFGIRLVLERREIERQKENQRPLHTTTLPSWTVSPGSRPGLELRLLGRGYTSPIQPRP